MEGLLIMRNGAMMHPPFEYEDADTAFNVALDAIQLGYYTRAEPDLLHEGQTNRLYFQLGPGSVLWALSKQAYQKQTENMRAAQQARQGLIAASENPSGKFKLMLQIPQQVEPPFGFDTREAAEEAAEDAIKMGYITHCVEPDHYVIVQTGPGTVFMVMSDETYQMQRRKAIEAAMQQAMMQQQAQQQQKKLIIPKS